jgi:hypothetical protein
VTDYTHCIGEMRRRDLLPPDPIAVFAAGSVVRGWGNAGSDQDFYVIGREPWPPSPSQTFTVALDPGTFAGETTFVDRQQWDLKYLTDGQIDQLLDKVTWAAYDANPNSPDMITGREVDILERLQFAQPVSGEDWLRRRRKQLRDSAIHSMVAARALHIADMFLEDALGQIQSDDNESAVLSAQTAFGHVVDALLASHGQIGRIAKWRARRFREASPEVLSFEEYWRIETMRDLDISAPAAWVEDVVLLCRRIALRVAV